MEFKQLLAGASSLLTRSLCSRHISRGASRSAAENRGAAGLRRAGVAPTSKRAWERMRFGGKASPRPPRGCCWQRGSGRSWHRPLVGREVKYGGEVGERTEPRAGPGRPAPGSGRQAPASRGRRCPQHAGPGAAERGLMLPPAPPTPRPFVQPPGPLRSAPRCRPPPPGLRPGSARTGGGVRAHPRRGGCTSPAVSTATCSRVSRARHTNNPRSHWLNSSSTTSQCRSRMLSAAPGGGTSGRGGALKLRGRSQGGGG